MLRISITFRFRAALRKKKPVSGDDVVQADFLIAMAVAAKCTYSTLGSSIRFPIASRIAATVAIPLMKAMTYLPVAIFVSFWSPFGEEVKTRRRVEGVSSELLELAAPMLRNW